MQISVQVCTLPQLAIVRVSLQSFMENGGILLETVKGMSKGLISYVLAWFHYEVLFFWFLFENTVSRNRTQHFIHSTYIKDILVTGFLVFCLK